MNDKTKAKPIDRVLAFWLTFMAAGVAVQIAGVTAYLPLSLIGPDPARGHLLLWVMPSWLVAVAVGVTLLLRPLLFRVVRDEIGTER